MLGLVAGVTSVSFWLAERSIRESFDAVQAAQLDEREASLLRMREARAREARRLAEAYAHNVRVLAAFIAYRDSPDADSAENLCDMAGAELLNRDRGTTAGSQRESSVESSGLHRRSPGLTHWG